MLNRKKTAEPLTLSTEGWEVMDKPKKGNSTLNSDRSKTAVHYLTGKSIPNILNITFEMAEDNFLASELLFRYNNRYSIRSVN